MHIGKHTYRWLGALVVSLLSGWSWAQQVGPVLTQAEAVSEDVYMAGGTVQVLADVDGDVVIAGGNVTVVQRVGADVLAAGGNVTVTAKVGDDVRAAGGSVTVTGDIGGDAILAGGTVILGPGNTVAGRAWLSGGVVNVAGHVRGGLKVAAGRIVIGGAIDGDVDLFAQSIEILSTAVIKGDVTYTSPNKAKVQNGANLEGAMTHRELELPGKRARAGASFLGSFLLFLSLGVCAVVVYWLCGQTSAAIVQLTRNQLLKCFALGLLALLVTPLVVLMLMVSMLGIPLGLALLAVYLVVLLAGCLMALVAVGDAGFRRLGWDPAHNKPRRVLSILAAAGTVWILSVIPFVGSVVLLLVLLGGAGAIILEGYRRYGESRHSSVSIPAPTASGQSAS